ncbi:hypothetical protein ABZ326_18605 [Streptomyces californicus]|uniref:hypothetical protein n=1 Tax=Streptomyces californicus TaxID=67351 RepID=UPI0034D97FAC
MKKCESSQILPKVFRGLRSTGVLPGAVAADLGITVEEMNKMLFGMVMTSMEGGGESTTAKPQRRLSLVT